MFREKLLSLPAKYPVTCLVVAALGGASGVWGIFSTRPLAAVLFESVGGVTMPAFPPYWITAPFAAIFLAMGIYFDRKRNSELGNVDASLKASESQLIAKRKELSNLIVHVEAVTAQCEAYKIKAMENDTLAKHVENLLNDKTKDYDELDTSFKEFKKQEGQWRIGQCGKKSETLNLSVVIKFIDLSDKELAKKIYALFWSDIPGSPWKTEQIDQIKWRENPIESPRIVIFSDHPHAHGIKAAINDCGLLTERVEVLNRSNETDYEGDITFVIFPESK